MKKRLHGILTFLLVLVAQLTFAQEKTVTGTVVDDGGMPLPGVNIIEKGTSNGTQSDFDGNYSISVEVGDVIVFSYVGFETQEVTVGSSNTYDVTLGSDAAALQEVVVMGYVAKRREDMTGSAVQVGSEDLQIPVASVDQALQGKVAGLNITNGSGTPGSVANIRIRGRSSITAGNEPLYVIDGVPITNGNQAAATSGSSLTSLASLNNNDIASITVLKDASATAAYGARGANGVIVITTKSGKSGKTSININSSYGFSNPAIDGPEVLTGAQREELFYESVQNTYLGEIIYDTDEARAWEAENVGTSYGARYRAWNAAGRPEANWGDRVRNYDAPIQEHTISATGGGEKYNFYSSLGIYKQEAITIGSDFERISGSLNFSHDLGENFKFSSSNTASHTFQDGILEGSAYFSSPQAVKFFMPNIDQPYNDDGSFNLNTTLPNPLFISQNDIDDQKFTRIISNNSLAWATPIDNLTFTTRASVDWRVYNYKRYRNRISGDGSTTNGYGYQAHRNSATYTFQNSLDYLLNLDRHDFTFKLLQEFQENRNYFLSADAEQFVTEGLTNLASAGTPTSASSTFTDWKVASYLGLLSYTFDDRYVINGTYRREGNSRFVADKRWGNFYSVGAAWNIQNEGFLRGSDVINMLKLRASYGVTGNANIGLNEYQVLFSYDADYAGTGASYPSTYGNPDLTWETSKQYDIGLDFAFWQNKINGTVSYYKRESDDLLLNVPLSLTTSFATQARNIGSMENSGFEAELEAQLVRSDDFNISLGGNFATNENEVTDMPVDGAGVERTITTTAQRVETGHPAYGWYLPTWAGVDPETGLDTYYVDGEGSEITENFNEANRVWQGESALPTITAGINLHVDFKGFFVDANAFYQGGHKVYESWHRYTQGTDLYSLGVYQGINTLMDRWQQPGDVTRVGKVRYAADPWRYNSKYLFEGDFARLRNVTFGYDFNSSMTDAVGIAGARVYVKGTNLATWVKDDNLIYDPEVDASGFTDITTPAIKSVIFGVNLKL